MCAGAVRPDLLAGMCTADTAYTASRAFLEAPTRWVSFPTLDMCRAPDRDYRCCSGKWLAGSTAGSSAPQCILPELQCPPGWAATMMLGSGGSGNGGSARSGAGALGSDGVAHHGLYHTHLGGVPFVIPHDTGPVLLCTQRAVPPPPPCPPAPSKASAITHDNTTPPFVLNIARHRDERCVLHRAPLLLGPQVHSAQHVSIPRALDFNLRDVGNCGAGRADHGPACYGGASLHMGRMLPIRLREDPVASRVERRL